MKDIEVLKKIREGDEKALDILYKKNYRMMTSLILKNNGTEDEAKDIFQDALIVFWQKAQSEDFILTSKISTYLYGVCFNLWRKELERKKRFTNEEKDGIVQIESNEERFALLHKCLDKLGDTCKKVLYLYYFDNLSMNIIAERLGFANADTAKTKKYKCKKELDAIVKKYYSESDFLD